MKKKMVGGLTMLRLGRGNVERRLEGGVLYGGWAQ